MSFYRFISEFLKLNFFFRIWTFAEDDERWTGQEGPTGNMNLKFKVFKLSKELKIKIIIFICSNVRADFYLDWQKSAEKFYFHLKKT